MTQSPSWLAMTRDQPGPGGDHDARCRPDL